MRLQAQKSIVQLLVTGYFNNITWLNLRRGAICAPKNSVVHGVGGDKAGYRCACRSLENAVVLHGTVPPFDKVHAETGIYTDAGQLLSIVAQNGDFVNSFVLFCGGIGRGCAIIKV